MSARLPAALGLAALAAACQAPVTYEDDSDREWFSLFVAGVDRRGSDADGIDDALGFGGLGGYDFAKSQHFQAGFELGLLWSSHEGIQIAGTDQDPELDVLRWDLGLRATLDLRPTNLLFYVHGGLTVRDEHSSDEPQLEEEGLGGYAGAGIDFFFDPTGRMGPFVRFYDSSDSNLSEVLVGLSVTFAL